MNAVDPVRAEGLYVSIGGLPILRDVNVVVRQGEAVALLGGNGSGKSTLIRALLGLVAHQNGTAALFGESVDHFTDWSRVGYVPQHSSITVPNATVREIASSGRLAHRRPFQWFSNADKDVVTAVLDQVGLADRMSWPFSSLSGGQKQRVLIARALAVRPELLVMDEPMAGVDLHSQDGLADLLADLRSAGLTMLVVLHERGPLAPILTRTVTLCDGRVVESEHPGGADCAPGEGNLDAVLGITDPISGVLP